MKLAKELDGHPLALATAGVYLDQTAGSFSDYLRLYKESWAGLKETSPELSSYEDRAIYATWQISFDRIKQQNDLAAQSLQIASTNDSDSDFSVASLESFNASTMASSATSISDIAPIVLDSATEMVNLLVKDQQLRDLLDESFKLLHSEKVTRNFRRALHSFSKELLLEAQTPTQEQAAKFVGQRSRQVSVLLRERIHPSESLQLSGHNGDTLREERLRDFLGGLQPMCTQDSLQPRAEEDSEQDDYGDPDDRPDLSTLREWLLASNAMQNLKDRFRLFLYPEKSSPRSKATADSPEKVLLFLAEEEHQIVFEGKDNINHGDPLTESTPDQILTENLFVNNPSVLSDLSDNLRKPFGPGYVRLEWTCVCSPKIQNLSITRFPLNRSRSAVTLLMTTFGNFDLVL